MSEEVVLDYEGSVAVISYNRPEKHNAFSDSMDSPRVVLVFRQGGQCRPRHDYAAKGPHGGGLEAGSESVLAARVPSASVDRINH